MKPPVDTLCYGDCLDWMERWDAGTVDLIYLDPPFNSNASYNLLYSHDSAGGAQTRAFADTWSWDAADGERLTRFEGAVARPAHRAIVGLAGLLGPSGMLAYLTYMAERLEHMHRLLKPTGATRPRATTGRWCATPCSGRTDSEPKSRGNAPAVTTTARKAENSPAGYAT